MKIFAITVLLVAVFSLPIFCQTSLAGKVIDGGSGEELIAANVTLYRAGIFIIGAATDFDGNYSINLDPGTYDVEVSYVGYQTCRVTSLIVKAGRINRFDLNLGDGGRMQLSQWQSWQVRQRNKKSATSFEFFVPEEHEGFIEILANEPKGVDGIQ